MTQDNNSVDVLRTGHYVGLHFQEGWWFLQTIGQTQVEMKPFILRNDNENRAEISAESAGSEVDEIRDGTGRNLIVPRESERDTVYQVSLGISPSPMQLFFKFGRKRAQELEDYAEPGDPAPVVNGFDSPYNNPTREATFFSVNDMEFPRIQAYNPTSEPREAKVSVHVNKIMYATVTDKSLMKAFLQQKFPCKLHEMGMGVKKRDRLDIPDWLGKQFGEHIYTTKEILSAEEDEGGPVGLLTVDGDSTGGNL